MINKEKLEIVKNLINEGKTQSEINRLTGISPATIRSYCKEFGLVFKKTKSKPTDEILRKINMYLDEGKTNKEIATLLEMSPTTIRKYTKEYLHKDTNSIKAKPINKEELKLTEIQLEILYGSLLGDMSIGFQGNDCRFTISQGGNQEAYFDHKCTFFKNILGKISKTDRYDKRTNKWYHKYQVRSKTHPIFTELYNFMYQNGIKTVTKEWLDKLTPRSIAFWYMDDGSIDGTLATNCFTESECKLVQQWFLEKYNIVTSLHHQKNKGGLQYLIYIKAESKQAFYNLIKDYIIPEMEYKFMQWNVI